MKIFFNKFYFNLFLLLSINFLFIQETLSQGEIKNYDFKKTVTNLQFPEGPAWDGKGNIFVSSCYGGYITKISEEGFSTFIDSTQKPFRLKQTNGLTFYKDGNLFACDYGIGAILKINSAGETEIYSSGYNGNKFNRPNDLAFDSKGNLFFTDPKSYGKDKPDGVIYRIDSSSKEVKPIAEGLCFPNGIAFSIDGKNLFVCESAQNRILKFYLSDDGSLKNQIVFAELPGGDPDGIAFDSEGNLYVAHFGSGNIFVLNPEGSIKYTIKVPGNKPSNLEFAGEDLRTLYVTEDETNSVYKVEVEIPGFPLFSAPSNGEKKY